MPKFHSHGKLLLTGEYVVLDGATALALPTKPGQSLEVHEIPHPLIKWKSLDIDENIWLQYTFPVSEILNSNSEKIPFDAATEKQLKMLFLTLQAAAKMNPEPFRTGSGFEITTRAEFPLDWGLGSSSTLIANLSKWLSIDAFDLLERSFGGSGYDIAVALHERPITYELQGCQKRVFSAPFNPEFKENLFFVHLNRKQNSRESIKQYKAQSKERLDVAVEKISSLTHKIITCTSLTEFNLLLEIHENIISQLIGLPNVKNQLFPDFSGAVKSLGGWGGDFVLATGSASDMNYFRRKGYETIIPYSKMIL